MPADATAALSVIPGHTLDKIRIHDDAAAHEAARGLSARAFTIGPSIYFGRGEYNPSTSAGLHVLAHEAAHAHQQANASLPPTDQLVVSSPSSHEERAAHRFADGLSGGAAPLPSQASSGSVARLMRMDFKAHCAKPIKVDIGQRINRSGFGGAWGFGTGDASEKFLFNWGCVLESLTTPEPGSDWRAGVTQVSKDYWLNVWWGEDKACHCGKNLNLNLKDSKVASTEDDANPWFDPATTSAPFTDAGQFRFTWIRDSPGDYNIPFRHPDPKCEKTSGKFNFGATLIAHITAFNRNSTADDESEDRFQHLMHVYWETMLGGEFDREKPEPERVTVKEGGITDVGTMLPGKHPTFPPKPRGFTALEAVCPITKCYKPTFPCPQLIGPAPPSYTEPHKEEQ